ncbi:hypothetical protein BC834DRAFT_823389 [Gloeopeniophorella convolvens]|nr:hypothetical protein BC834DRAFT_823389 [Gloeopeniophorella convolvens]
MRKTSYAVTFLLVSVSLVLNVLSATRNDWLVDKGREIFYTRVVTRYGLMRRCERSVTKFPSSSGEWDIVYTGYKCRDFPKSVSDQCDDTNRYFCAAWTSAGFCAEIGIGFGAMALLALLFGVSTHSRRRRIWKAVAGLVALNALFSMVAFAVVTDLFRTSGFSDFINAQPGTAWYINLVSWLFSFVVAFGVVWTGVAADKGHKWAAGNRAYTRIEDHD